jgi:3-oxoacyl-[acyl-carrier protein] reductase
MKPLEGKTALVTGASRGIGKAIALRFGKDGASVGVAYNQNAASAEDVVTSIQENGGQAFAIHAPLGGRGDASSLWKEFDRQAANITGKAEVDIVVNNAAIPYSSDLASLTEAEFDRLFAVNVRAPFFIVQNALKRLRNGGRIINISSFAARVASTNIMAYASTKGAIDVFTRNLASELGPRGITANSVHPGVIDTDTNAGWLHSSLGQKNASSYSALGRVGQPNDIADVVAFLASDDARWITGSVIDVSGGSRL